MPAVDPYTLTWQQFGRFDAGVAVTRHDPQGDVLPHDHLFHELALIDRGRADHATAAGTHPLASGDVVVIRPQVWHAYQRASRDFAVVNCLIAPRLLHRLLPVLGRGEVLHRRDRAARGAAPLVVRPTRAEVSRIRRALDEIEAEQRARGAAWQAAAVGALLGVLAVVGRAAAEGRVRAGSGWHPPATLSDRMEAAVLDAAHRVESQLADPVDVAALAAELDVNAAHLSRSFARRMGTSLVAYVHRLRAEEACRLLRLTDVPVTSIATRLGYGEVAYFSRQFKAHVGRSPLAYRRGSQGRAG